MHSYDGSKCFDLHRVMLLSEWEKAGKEAAEKLLQQPGAAELIEDIRNRKLDDEDFFN